MGKVTKVSNDTDAVIELKQGSANVFHLLHSLPKGKTYNIKVDESATYREYWCAVQPVPAGNPAAAERVVFSSDDCAEYSKVRIYKDKNDKYTWEGTEKRGAWRNTAVQPAKGPTPVSTGEGSTTPGDTQVSAPSPTPVQDAKPPSVWQQITGVFRKKN